MLPVKTWRRRARGIASAYLFSVGIWVGFAVLMGTQYRVIDLIHNIRATIWDAFALAAVRCLTFSLLTPPIFLVVRHYPVHGKHSLRRLVGYLCAAPVFVVSYACIRWSMYPTWNGVSQTFSPRSWQSLIVLMRDGFADQVTMYIAIVVAAHAYAYFDRSRTQELHRSELEQALAASELQALKSQLSPHFLFNTLHGISTLIDSDGRSAKAMIIKISGLLRSALKHGASDLVPLEEELKFVSAYLDLEKMRLGSRLTVRWKIDTGLDKMLVPQFILQPLVENAVLHGVSCCREGGWIGISAHSDGQDGKFILEVGNSVAGSRAPGTGLGLKNTGARLRYLYSDEASFAFSVSDDRIAVARLALPALRGSSAQSSRPEAETAIQLGEGGTYARAHRG